MLELKTFALMEPGQAPGPLSSVLKLRASRMRQAIAELGMEVLGPDSLRWHGAGDEGAIEVAGDTLLPDFLNSRAATIFGGAQEVQLGIIAKTLLGNAVG